jgi:hypothetical protein
LLSLAVVICWLSGAVWLFASFAVWRLHFNVCDLLLLFAVAVRLTDFDALLLLLLLAVVGCCFAVVLLFALADFALLLFSCWLLAVAVCLLFVLAVQQRLTILLLLV